MHFVMVVVVVYVVLFDAFGNDTTSCACCVVWPIL
jgi:hypothetical protein